MKIFETMLITAEKMHMLAYETQEKLQSLRRENDCDTIDDEAVLMFAKLSDNALIKVESF